MLVYKNRICYNIYTLIIKLINQNGYGQFYSKLSKVFKYKKIILKKYVEKKEICFNSVYISSNDKLPIILSHEGNSLLISTATIQGLNFIKLSDFNVLYFVDVNDNQLAYIKYIIDLINHYDNINDFYNSIFGTTMINFEKIILENNYEKLLQLLTTNLGFAINKIGNLTYLTHNVFSTSQVRANKRRIGFLIDDSDTITFKGSHSLTIFTFLSKNNFPKTQKEYSLMHKKLKNTSINYLHQPIDANLVYTVYEKEKNIDVLIIWLSNILRFKKSGFTLYFKLKTLVYTLKSYNCRLILIDDQREQLFGCN